MAAGTPPPDPMPAGLVLRAPEEIARLLGALAARAEPLRSDLHGGNLSFITRLLLVDPDRKFILLEASSNDVANEALLARPRASFRAMAGGTHVEFAAAGPARAQRDGKPAIRMQFPEVMATIQRREHARLAVQPHAPLHVVVDAAGVMSFEGAMVDVSEGGIGFVQYAPNITLEPGTILSGCRIEIPGGGTLVVDLEVRYSCPVADPGGRQALRSGCRFVGLSADAKAKLAQVFRR